MQYAQMQIWFRERKARTRPRGVWERRVYRTDGGVAGRCADGWLGFLIFGPIGSRRTVPIPGEAILRNPFWPTRSSLGRSHSLSLVYLLQVVRLSRRSTSSPPLIFAGVRLHTAASPRWRRRDGQRHRCADPLGSPHISLLADSMEDGVGRGSFFWHAPTPSSFTCRTRGQSISRKSPEACRKGFYSLGALARTLP